jgi:uridine kinase
MTIPTPLSRTSWRGICAISQLEKAWNRRSTITRCIHDERETLRLAPAPVIIVEGILLLTYPALREACDIKFFMDTPLDICLLRRIRRDLQERGRTLDSVIDQYEATVRPMYHEFIRPSSRYADMVITGGGRNRVALDVIRNLVLTQQRGASS